MTLHHIAKKIDGGHYQEALKALTALLEKDSENAEALYLVGVCLFRQKNFTQASKVLGQSIAHAPAVNAYYYLGLCNERLGDEETAQKYYQMTLALDPNHALALNKVSPDSRQQEDDVNKHPQTGQQVNTDPVTDPGQLLGEGNRKMLSYPVHLTIFVTLFVFTLMAQGGSSVGYSGLSFIKTIMNLPLELFNVRYFIHPITFGIFLTLIAFGLLYLRSRNESVTLYARRLDFEKGVLRHTTWSIWNYELRRAEYKQSLWLRLINSATIELEREADKPVKIIAIGSAKRMRDLKDELRNWTLKERLAVKKMWS